MTANAMQGDRDKCIAAGMNDHLGKPIEPEELWKAVLRWIRPREGLGRPRPVEQVPIAVPAADKTDSNLDVPGLNTEDGLRRMGGNRKLFLSMLRKFISGNRTVCAQTEEALRADDWKTAERLAHTVKGVAGNLGAFQVQSEAAQLESLLRRKEAPEEVDRQLAVLQSKLAQLFTDLERALPPDRQTTVQVELDWEKVKAVCARLDSLLNESDADAADVVVENADLIGAAFPDHYSRISDAIQDYDFETALAALHEAQAGKTSVLRT